MNVYFSLLLSFLLALYAYIKKSFTKAGLATAFIICFVMCYCGGYNAFLALLSLFAITILTDKFKKEKKETIINNLHYKNDRRDSFQVLDNLLLSTIFIIIYKLTEKDLYYLLFYISLAISASDTAASGIGILSNKSYNILSLKKSTRGLSGNVSILGLTASLIAPLLIGIISFTYKKSLYNIVIICIFGFIGSLIDSILGCFQAKYKCLKCNTITEKKTHCEVKTVYYKGFNVLNNDLVNVLSNLLSILLYIFVSLII